MAAMLQNAGAAAAAVPGRALRCSRCSRLFVDDCVYRRLMDALVVVANERLSISDTDQAPDWTAAVISSSATC